ncbi:MAG: DNA replication/repair protein RecF [Oceanospirillaceae bacterium]|nr:DNA replication/repair protein RecF [Oceanospirillaceae bacterium]
MPIQKLHLQHIRNLTDVRFEPSSRINILHGANGSGKTSLLEGIHFLGLTRSFRNSQIRHLVQSGSESCLAFAQIDAQPGKPVQPLGVERRLDGEVRVRHAGQSIELSQLAQLLPLQVIDSDTFLLLEGSPSIRRQFIDWGVFHSDRSFIQLWRGFRRVLKQRNSLLKCGKIDPRLRRIWDREFVAFAEQMTQLREQYIELLKPDFEATLGRLLGGVNVELRFSPGWDRKTPLDQLLEEGLARDLKQGFTGVGPQRADLRVRADGHNAAERLSRGQKKLVVSALKLAQGALFYRLNNRPCIYLIDDLPSELDERHSRLFCQFLEDTSNQCFITCVDPSALDGIWRPDTAVRRFRVEAGAIAPAD